MIIPQEADAGYEEISSEDEFIEFDGGEMGMEFEMDEDYSYPIPAFSPFQWDIQPLVVGLCITSVPSISLHSEYETISIQLCRGLQKCKKFDIFYYFCSKYSLWTYYPEENNISSIVSNIEY